MRAREPRIDVVVASDVLYSEQFPQGELRLATLQALCARDTKVYIAAHRHHNAALVDDFVAQAQRVFEVVEDVIGSVPEEWRCEGGVVYYLSDLRSPAGESSDG